MLPQLPTTTLALQQVLWQGQQHLLKLLLLLLLLQMGGKHEWCDVHCNKYTAMQTAVPAQSQKQFWNEPNRINRVTHCNIVRPKDTILYVDILCQDLQYSRCTI